MAKDDLKEDEKFVIEAQSKYVENDLQFVLEEYFDKKYSKKLGDIALRYNEIAGIWEIQTPTQKRKVAVIESLPAAIQELMKL